MADRELEVQEFQGTFLLQDQGPSGECILWAVFHTPPCGFSLLLTPEPCSGTELTSFCPQRLGTSGVETLGPACQPLQSGRWEEHSASMKVLMDCLQQALALSGAGWEGAGACKFSSRTCEWGLGPMPGHHCEELMEVRTRKSLLLPCPGSGTTK